MNQLFERMEVPSNSTPTNLISTAGNVLRTRIVLPLLYTWSSSFHGQAQEKKTQMNPQVLIGVWPSDWDRSSPLLV